MTNRGGGFRGKGGSTLGRFAGSRFGAASAFYFRLREFFAPPLFLGVDLRLEGVSASCRSPLHV